MDVHVRERGTGRGSAVVAAQSAYFGRLIPQPSVATPEPAAAADGGGGAHSHAAQAAHNLRNALIPETRFYRVLRESKLFAIDFGAAAAHESAVVHTEDRVRNGAEILQSPGSLAESDYKVVRIEELTRQTGTRSGRPQPSQPHDRKGALGICVARFGGGGRGADVALQRTM